MREVPLSEALAGAGVVMSIVPPHAAADVAQDVAARGFKGLYIDANAVSPETARRVASIVKAAGASYVDGSIMGPPPREAGQTNMYFSGACAREAAALLGGSIVDARVLGDDPTAASALKMCFAAWTKGSAALLLAIGRLARSHDLLEPLLREWEESVPELPARLERTESRIHEKAWRYIGEMEEIARTFESQGLPPGFGQAAAAIYRDVDREHPRG